MPGRSRIRTWRPRVQSASPPEECLVVDNAPLGIESAKAAGMYRVTIQTTLGREYLSQADYILSGVGDLDER